MSFAYTIAHDNLGCYSKNSNKPVSKSNKRLEFNKLSDSETRSNLRNKSTNKPNISYIAGIVNACLTGAGAIMLGTGTALQNVNLPAIPANCNVYLTNPDDTPTVVYTIPPQKTNAISQLQHLNAEKQMQDIGETLSKMGWSFISASTLTTGTQFATMGIDKKINQPSITLGGLALMLDAPLLFLNPGTIPPKAAMFLALGLVNSGYANFARNEVSHNKIINDTEPLREYSMDFLTNPEVYKNLQKILLHPTDQLAKKEMIDNFNKAIGLLKFAGEDQIKVIKSPIKLVRQAYEEIEGYRDKLPTCIDYLDVQDPLQRAKVIREDKRIGSLLTYIGGSLMFMAAGPLPNLLPYASALTTAGTVFDSAGMAVKGMGEKGLEKWGLLIGIVSKVTGTTMAAQSDAFFSARALGDTLVRRYYALQAKGSNENDK